MSTSRPGLTAPAGAVILDRNLAGGIACGKLSPFTGLEWQPALKQDSLVGFQTALSEGGTGTGHGFGPGGPTGNPYTYHETAAARMPDPSDKLTGWTMDHLAGALNVRGVWFFGVLSSELYLDGVSRSTGGLHSHNACPIQMAPPLHIGLRSRELQAHLRPANHSNNFPHSNNSRALSRHMYHIDGPPLPGCRPPQLTSFPFVVLVCIVSFFFIWQELRCTERAGIGGFTREELVQLTHWCSKVLQESGLAGNRLLFRQPQIPTTHVDILHQVFPDLPPPGEHWSTDYDTLIPYLPEMQEAVILAWLCLDGERKNWSNPPTEDGTGQPQRWEAPARVLARGMERAMDLGSLTGLKGTFVGNILYVQHRYECVSPACRVWSRTSGTRMCLVMDQFKKQQSFF